MLEASLKSCISPEDLQPTSFLFMNQAGSHLEAEAFVGQLHPFLSLAPASQPENTTSWVSSHEALGVPTRVASLCLGKQASSCLPKLGQPAHAFHNGGRVKLPGSQGCRTKVSSASVAAWSTEHHSSQAVMPFSKPGAAHCGIVCPACVMNFPNESLAGELIKWRPRADYLSSKTSHPGETNLRCLNELGTY